MAHSTLSMKRSVLIIEDDDSIRESLEMFLREEGYEVSSSIDGREGLDLLETRFSGTSPRPGLILLDMNMPKMTGQEFLVIQKNHPDLKNIPVAAFTAANKTKPELADAFIRKPVMIEDLLSIVEKYCG